MTRYPIVLLLCGFLAGCGDTSTSSVRSQAARLTAVQLRLSDLTSGFYLERRRTLGSRETAVGQHLDAVEYARGGGESSVSELFARRHPTDFGLTEIFDQVFSFRSVSTARLEFAKLHSAIAHSGTIGTVQQYVNVGATPTPLPTIIAILKHPVPPPVTQYDRTSVPTIGNESTGFTNTSAAYAGEYVFTNQLVLFREGQYCVVLHISGSYGQVPMTTAVTLAHRIDARIRAMRP